METVRQLISDRMIGVANKVPVVPPIERKDIAYWANKMGYILWSDENWMWLERNR